MKENLYKTMMFFCKKEFNAANFTSEERLFIRQYKMMGMADPDQVPTNLTEGNLEHIEQRALAADLGISRRKLRIKGSFEKKSRPNKVTDDPEIILKVRNFFELAENSSQGDRVRNIVQINGIDEHRRYLRTPLDIIGRNFLATFPIKYISLSSVKRIVKKHLKHLTIPTKRLVCKFLKLPI